MFKMFKVFLESCCGIVGMFLLGGMHFFLEAVAEAGVKSFLHSSPDGPWSPNKLLCGKLGAHSRGQRGRGLALTTSSHLSSRLGISSYTSPLYYLHGMLQDEITLL